VVVIGDLRVKAYDPKTGEDRWVVRGLAAYPCTTPTPGSDGNLYVATWSTGSSNERNMPEWKDFLAMMDKDKDGKLSRTDSEGTFMADFFAIFDKNKNGFIDPEEWQSSLDFLARGKNVVMAIRPGGRGDITDSHVLWTNEKGAPYVASPLFYDGRVYLVKDGGMLTIYESATGKVLTDKERLGVQGDFYASPIAAGGRIVVASTGGTVLTIKPGDTPEVLSKVDLGEGIAATPAVLDSVLYVRTANHLWAFGPSLN
jgi:outer membrane protein assembly factor BamB